MIHEPDYYSFENILQRMLDSVTEEVDKRQGSIIYDALAPAAYELAGAYLDLDNFYKESFVATASGAYLDSRAGECGLERIPATYTKLEASFLDSSGAKIDNIETGSRYAIADMDLYFFVTGKAGDIYTLECEQAGAAGNIEGKTLLPLENVEGLAKIQYSISIPGQDAESDEALRERMRQQWAEQPADGNKAQYIKWAMAYPGVGGAKIYPGSAPNTVDIYLIDTQGKPAGNGLVESFQKYIDPKEEEGQEYGQGLGEGKAPLGAMVKVNSARSVSVQIDITVAAPAVMNEAEEMQWLQGLCEKTKIAAEQYFFGVAFKKNEVDYFALAAAVLKATGLDGMQSFKMNNADGNIQLQSNQVPVLGSITISDGSKTQQLGGDTV